MNSAAHVRQGSLDEPCPPPHSHPQPPTLFELPPGATDTHAHVIGPGPYNEERGYTSRPHSPEEYLGMLDAVGFTRAVLVQPTVHGTDNSYLLRALRKYPERLRGVAVIGHDAKAAELQALKDAGVMGIRLVASTPGGVGLSHIDRYEAICKDMGWHMQLMVDAHRMDLDVQRRLARLQVSAVIDHMGHFPVGEGSKSSAAMTMRSLLAEGHWVKLSGAFRLSNLPDMSDATPIAQMLVETAPDRCMWGSDWPHVNFWTSMPSMQSLVDLLAQWTPDEQQRRRVLVDNPQRLYSFPARRDP